MSKPLKPGDRVYQVYKYKNGIWKFRAGEVVLISATKRLGIMYEDSAYPGSYLVRQHTGSVYFGGPPWFRNPAEAVTSVQQELLRLVDVECRAVAAFLLPGGDADLALQAAVQSDQEQKPSEKPQCSVQQQVSSQ